MNIAEKIAATYLRLNGFFLLPHFTTFIGNYHNHCDLIALRAANSAEYIEKTKLITDHCFFKELSDLLGKDASGTLVGVAAEVRTNRDKDNPAAEHEEYITDFLGGIAPACLSFYQFKGPLRREDGVVVIPLHHAWSWIMQRIDWMQRQVWDLNKHGSWTLSEEFLSDILVLREKGFLRNCDELTKCSR